MKAKGDEVMTLNDWLHSKANDVDEVLVFSKEHEPLTCWRDNDPKYEAQVFHIAKGDTCAIVEIDFSKLKEAE